MNEINYFSTHIKKEELIDDHQIEILVKKNDDSGAKHFERQMNNATLLSCSQFGEEIVKNM